MTGWPWPLDGVQNWFEDLWNWVSESAFRAVEWLWGEIRAKIDWVVQSIADSASWIWDQISPVLSDIKMTLAELAIGAGIAIGDIGSMLSDAFSDVAGWIADQVIAGIQSAQSSITGGIEWLKLGIGSFVDQILFSLGNLGDWLAEKIWGWFDGTLRWLTDVLGEFWDKTTKEADKIASMLEGTPGKVVDEVKTALDGAMADVQSWISGTLAGIVEALGKGLQSFWDWLLKSLGYVAEMIVGAVDFVIAKVSGAFNALITGFLDMVTDAMSGKSPDPDVKRAADVMIATMWDTQLKIIEEGRPHSPSPQLYSEVAMGVVSSLTAASAGSMSAGAAADATHPAKSLHINRTIRELLWFVGVPAVMASIMTLPSSVGLLIPLRYELMAKMQPMQPGASDIIRFAVRECFIKRRLKVLLERYPGEEYTNAMAREGFNKAWAEMYWGAHWVLPSITHLNEYLYRHDEFIEKWRDYIIYHDYIPESVPWLEEVIYPPYTRVDIRRMWDMRTVTEEDVYRNYRWLGYDDAHAEGMTFWTKIYTAFPDLIARWKNGWITEEDVERELVALGMPRERAIELIQTKVKPSQPERVAGERDLTKAEISKGVGLEILTPEEGVLLLMDMGYDEYEAWYILAIRGVLERGHPDGFWEMKKVTEQYKRAVGRPFKEVSKDLIELEKLIKEKRAEIAKRREAGVSEADLAGLMTELGNLEYRMRQLLISREQSK